MQSMNYMHNIEFIILRGEAFYVRKVTVRVKRRVGSSLVPVPQTGYRWLEVFCNMIGSMLNWVQSAVSPPSARTPDLSSCLVKVRLFFFQGVWGVNWNITQTHQHIVEVNYKFIALSILPFRYLLDDIS